MYISGNPVPTLPGDAVAGIRAAEDKGTPEQVESNALTGGIMPRVPHAA